MTTKNAIEYKAINQDLFEKYEETEDLEIRNQILELNLGLVKKEVSHWMNRCEENYDDLLQVGVLGLVRAVDRFDRQKGYAFSSFAIPYIKGEIQHYLRDKGHCVRIPRRFVELKQQSNKIVRELRVELNRQPTDREIASQLGVSLKDWEEVKLANINKEPMSLDLSANDQDSKTTLVEYLPDNKYRSFQLAQEDQIRLQNALGQLEEGTRQVLEFVFLQDLTQKETAEALGVSVITISRRLKKGIATMRQLIKPEEF